MNFSRSRSPVRLVLPGALLVGAFALCFSFARSGRSPAPAAPARRSAPTALARPLAAPIVPAVAALPLRPAFAPLATVLPGLPKPPTDWRYFTPAQLVVEPLPGHPVTFTATSVTRDVDSTVWAGGAGIAGSALVGVGSRDGWDAILTIPGANEYEIHVRGKRVAVIEKNPGADVCGHDGTVALAADARAGGSVAPASSTPPALADAAAVATVDVLFFYDADTLAAASARAPDGNGTSLIDSLLRARLTLCNGVLAHSGVTNLQWRYLGSRLVPAHPRSGRLLDDLNAMTDPTTDAGRFMTAEAAGCGADQAVLLVGGPADYAGLAFVPGHQAVVSWEAGYETTAHELAHNFGCQHDRQTDNAPEGNGLYGYGYRFASAGRDCGDIMSYAGYRFPLFSNPDLAVDLSTYIIGLPAGPVVFGVADNQPQAADGARLLRENAAAMADYRPAVVVAPPVLATQPVDVLVSDGGAVTLSVSAGGGGLTYQWRKNGGAIAGATGATYTVATATPTDAGNYDCLVTNALGTATSSVAALSVSAAAGRPIAAPPTAGGRLVNLSARALVGSGTDLLIGGLTIDGGRARILVRAVGPTLAHFGVTGTLGDPLLRAFDAAGHSIAENDNWSAGANAAEVAFAAAKIGATPLPAGSGDAALLLTLEPGCYTFHVMGADGGTGIALLEIYLVDDAGLPGTLVNLSARAFVGTEGDVLITGFVTQGDAQVLVRGVGPTLGDYGVPGVMASPLLEVYDGAVLRDQVRDWGTTYSAAQASALFRKVGAFPLGANTHDSVAVLDLAGGAVRTVQVKGDNRSTGVALAEVYLVRP